MDLSSDFKKTVDISVPRQLPTATRKTDKQTLVEQGLTKTLEAGKDERETTAVLIILHEMALHDLDQAIGRATNDLMERVEEFDSLSLNGGLLAHMEKTVRFMEDKYTAMKKMHIDRAKLMEVSENLGHMKKNLELLSHTMERRE